MRIYAPLFALLAPMTCFTNAVEAGPAQPCDRAEMATLREGIAEADGVLAKIWVKRGPDWHVAYDIAAVPKNPFALRNLDYSVPASHGYVWARDVTCSVSASDKPGIFAVTYTAAAYRFKEERTKWSMPLADGVIAEFSVTIQDTKWSLEDKSREQAVFLPENSMRRPRTGELPPLKVWPDPRCPPPNQWQENECLRPPAKAAVRNPK